MAEQSAVNRFVVGSSPIVSAILNGLLEKWLNSYPFQGYIHGFESRTGHHKSLNASPEDSDAFSFIGIQDVEDDFYPPVVADDNFRNKIEIKMAA